MNSPALLAFRSNKGRLPAPVRNALAAFWAVSLLCYVTEALCRLLHWGYPYVWPLAPPYPPFTDFTSVVLRFDHFGTGSFFAARGFPFTYPAPVSLVFAAAHATPKPLVCFLTFSVAAFAVAGGTFQRALLRTGLRRRDVWLLVASYAASFPLWFELEQANSEVVVWAVCALGLWAFLRDRPLTASALFGAAGAMKLFPFIFMGLLLSDRGRYRAAAVACTVALCLTVCCLQLETGSMRLSWYGTAAGLEYFRVHWAMGQESTGFDHSLFGFAKRVTGWGAGPQHVPLAAILSGYTALAAEGVVALYVGRIRKLPKLNRSLH